VSDNERAHGGGNPGATPNPALPQLVAATQATLARIAADFAPAVFASSLAAEDMVLTDLILKAGLPIRIFTLETGRLHAETLAMLERVQATYGYAIEPYRPEPQAVAAYVAANGLNGFYDSVALRQECCRIRKVEPLNRALAGNAAWVTGQRRAQSSTRASLDVQENDPARNMQKLIRWRTGRKMTSGNTSTPTPCPTIRCTTRVTRRSAARPAPAPSSPAKMSAPGAGGGKIPSPRSAVCMWSMASWCASSPPLPWTSARR
jgi:hypothetical protein